MTDVLSPAKTADALHGDSLPGSSGSERAVGAEARASLRAVLSWVEGEGEGVSETKRWASEQALMRAVASRDPVAERELVERMLGRVRRRAYMLTRKLEDADDATQTAMLEILRSAGSYGGTGSLEGWCDRIVVRTTVRMQRKRARQHSLVDGAVEPDAIEVAHDDPSQREAIPGEVAQYLESLSDERRQALVLRHVLDYSIDDIAELTGVSRNTVKDRLRVAREQIRKLIHRAEVVALGRGRTSR